MSSSRAADLVSKLALQPHPEGGHYREVFRSPHGVTPADDLKFVGKNLAKGVGAAVVGTAAAAVGLSIYPGYIITGTLDKGRPIQRAEDFVKDYGGGAVDWIGGWF